MRTLILLATILLIVKVSGDCSSASSLGDSSIYPTDYTSSQSGTGTYYSYSGDGGECTLSPVPPIFANNANFFSSVAIADNIWAGSKACGMCINITATGTGSGANPLKGSYLVYVNNECPSCSTNGIDIGTGQDGAWGITWQAVPYPIPANSFIQFLFAGSNSYYIKLQVRNTRYPVYQLGILMSGTYVFLQRTSDNFFTAPSGFPFPLVFPMTVKIVASTGDFVIDSIASLVNSQVIQGSTQFLDCSGTGSSPTIAPTTKPTTPPTTPPTTKPTTTPTTPPTTPPTTIPTTRPTTTPTTPPTTPPTTIPTTRPTTRPTSSATITPTSAPTSAPTTAPGTTTNVYLDSVIAPFQDWSWATRTPCDPSLAIQGTCSYGFSPSNWGAAYFRNPNQFSSASGAIQFYYYTPNVAIEVNLQLVQGSNGAGKSIAIKVPSANTWTLVTVQMSQLANGVVSGMCDGFWFQDGSGVTQAEVHLDDILIVGQQ